MWSQMPEPLILKIFMSLSSEDMCKICCVCRQWSRIGNDEQLWRQLFYKRFDTIDRSIQRPIDSFGYREEAKRLIYHTPKIESETLREHTNQVLHVSFAHNGLLFSSCSRDGFVKVWSTESVPTRVKHSADMKHYSWSYTQFSQFNASDTLLLVSGVHFGAHTASGEIAVFNIAHDFQLQCRVLNKPYDIFGTWYTNDYLISSRLHFLGHLVSCSALWLNKAWQESESERKPIIKRMFKFYNKNASSIRTVLVADCLASDDQSIEDQCIDSTEDQTSTQNRANCDTNQRGNPVSSLGHPGLSSTTNNQRLKSLQTPPNYSSQIDYFGAQSNISCTNESPIRYSAEYRFAEQQSSSATVVNTNRNENINKYFNLVNNENSGCDSADSDFDDPPLPWNEDWLKLSDDDIEYNTNTNSCLKSKLKSKKKSFKERKKVLKTSNTSSESEDDSEPHRTDCSGGRMLCNRDKLLVFTSGSQTYTPHQIGIKRIKPFRFEEFVTETASLSKRLEERRQEKEQHVQQQAVAASPNWHEEEAVRHMFDTVDHIIDLKGHIIGMGLSPDHRYLYVNSRSWPENATIDHPLHPPPIAQQIDIHVIDLKTFKSVGQMFRSHKAYTPNDECFFIFLDVSDQFVASGAEDNHGYVWDRHYGLCLAKLPHLDIVNSVAFNPMDREMLITASDDFTLKIWRSKSKMSAQKLAQN